MSILSLYFLIVLQISRITAPDLLVTTITFFGNFGMGFYARRQIYPRLRVSFQLLDLLIQKPDALRLDLTYDKRKPAALNVIIGGTYDDDFFAFFRHVGFL